MGVAVRRDCHNTYRHIFSLLFLKCFGCVGSELTLVFKSRSRRKQAKAGGRIAAFVVWALVLGCCACCAAFQRVTVRSLCTPA